MKGKYSHEEFHFCSLEVSFRLLYCFFARKVFYAVLIDVGL